MTRPQIGTNLVAVDPPCQKLTFWRFSGKHLYFPKLFKSKHQPNSSRAKDTQAMDCITVLFLDGPQVLQTWGGGGGAGGILLVTDRSLAAIDVAGHSYAPVAQITLRSTWMFNQERK